MRLLPQDLVVVLMFRQKSLLAILCFHTTVTHVSDHSTDTVMIDSPTAFTDVTRTVASDITSSTLSDTMSVEDTSTNSTKHAKRMSRGWPRHKRSVCFN
jgi:hypothetical protein